MGDRPARERDAADALPGLERPHLGDDAPLAQVGHEQIEAAELEVAAEDGSDRLCFRLIDGNPAILRVIADSDEVARAFRDDVARCSDMMSPGVRCLAGG